MTAKLSSSLCTEFCYCFDCRVGIPPDVRSLESDPSNMLTIYRANTQGLIDGGLAGLFWAYIWNFIGFSFVVLSLAEMASMSVQLESIRVSLTITGHLFLEDNITGSLSSRLRNIKSSSVISQVRCRTLVTFKSNIS